MADTNDLRVIVGLDVKESALEIEKDLPELEKLLASKESGRLKIVGQLNVRETEKLINAQLSELNIDKTALKITPQLDISSNNNISEQISKQVSNATKNVDFSAIAKNLRKAFNINDNASIKEATENIKAMYEAFNVDPAKYKDAFNKLIGWYEQRSNDFVRTEREKVDELNNLMLELYNQPELHTTLPSLIKAPKNNPLVVTKGTLEEMKSLLGSMKEVYKLFGSIRVDDKHGALIGSFGEDWDPKEYNDSLAVYIKYLQKIQELRKSSRFQPTDVMPQSEYESIIRLTEQDILQQLGLVNANNKVIQSNEQVAQSERDVAQAQKEANNAKKDADTNKGSDDALKRLMRSTEILEKIAKQYELIKYYQQQQTQYKVGTEEWEHYNKAWQEEAKRLEVTKQIAKEEGLVTEEYKRQAIEIQKSIDEKYAQLNNTKTIRNNNGGNYISNNQVQDIFASLNEAERYFKNFNLGNVTSSLTKGSLQNLKDFVIEVKSATGEVEKFRYAVENIGDDQNPQLVYKLTDIKAANAGIERLTESMQKYYASVESTVISAQSSAQKIKASWSDVNGGKSVQDTAHLSALQSKYAELMMTIESLRGADENTLKTLKANIKSQEVELNALVSSYHNAEKVATDLRTKGFETVKDITGSKIDTLEQSIVNTLGSTEKLSVELGNIRSKFDELGKAGLTQEAKATLLTQILDDIDKTKAKLGTLNEVEKGFKSLSTEMDSAYRSFKKFDDSSVLKNNFNNQDVIAFRDTVANLRIEYDKLNAELAQTPKTSDAYKKLRADLDTLSPKLKNAENAYSELQTRLHTAGGEQQADARLQRLINRIKEYMSVNTKASKKYATQFQSLLSQASVKQDIDGIRRLEMEFGNLTSQIKIAGDQGKTFGQSLVDNIKKFSSWMSLTSLVMRGVRSLKQMVTTVKEIDTAMTALKRVTDETASSYDNFLKNAAKQAQRLHTTIDSLTAQITEWVKLGNDFNTAQKLAEVSMMYSKVGDIDDATAVKDLVATMKAFEVEADNAIDIVSALDLANNKYAVTAKDLGEGLRIASSSMSAAGNSFEKTLAMLTGGTEITQDANSMATAMRTIALRLRNMKGSLQELGEEYEDLESISKVQTQILNLSGVNIFDPNDNFRDTYDILKDISEVYNDLKDADKAMLDSIIFGTNRANQGQAILKAFQTGQIQKALKDIENSAGTAEEEFERWGQSIEAAIETNKAAAQELALNLIDDETIKGFVNAGTTALNILNDIVSTFGTLQSLIPAIAFGLSAFKNVGSPGKSGVQNKNIADYNVVVTRNEFMAA